MPRALALLDNISKWKVGLVSFECNERIAAHESGIYLYIQVTIYTVFNAVLDNNRRRRQLLYFGEMCVDIRHY